jgi:hypothetical protein
MKPLVCHHVVYAVALFANETTEAHLGLFLEEL